MTNELNTEQQAMNDFNNAVTDFWQIANKAEHAFDKLGEENTDFAKTTLADAAKNVFAAQEGLQGNDYHYKVWDDVTEDIDQIGKYLDRRQVSVSR